MSVSALATATKTCRPPVSVSTLPTRTSRCRSPSSQLRMEVEIQGHGDRRSRRIRPHRGLIPKLRTNFQSVQTQSFRVVSGVDREHLPQHVSSHPVSHQGREMRLKLIQLRRRAAIRWPTMAGFVAAAPSTAKAGKPHRDLAEKRRDRMVPVILHSAHLATASAVRPPDGVALGLCAQTISCWRPASNSFPSARVNPKLAISPRSSGRLIFKTSAHCLSPSAPVFTNLTIQATRLPPIRDQTRNYRFGARTPNLQAVPLEARPCR